MKRAVLLLVIASCGGRAFQAGTQDQPFLGNDSGVDSGFDASGVEKDSGSLPDSSTSLPDSGLPDSALPDSSTPLPDAACSTAITLDYCAGFSPFKWPTYFCALQGPAGNGIVRVDTTPDPCNQDDCSYTCACIIANYPFQGFNEDSGYSCSVLDGGGISIVYP